MKTAVVLYGFLRTFACTANSLIKHVLKPNNADLFIFAPSQCGVLNNKNINKTTNLDCSLGRFIDKEELYKQYGEYLKLCELWDYSESKILDNSIDISKIPVIANIHPIRIFSMFYHIKKSLELIKIYEEQMNFRYDNVILTRPDLAFYSLLNINDLAMEKINIPYMNGCIDSITKEKINYGPAPVFYYKNVLKGELIPQKRYYFQDQLIISNRDNIMQLIEIYPMLEDLISEKLPFNPETIMFYFLHFIKQHDIETSICTEYEIFRTDMSTIESYMENKEKVENIKFDKNLYRICKLYLILKYKFCNKEKYLIQKQKLKTLMNKEL